MSRSADPGHILQVPIEFFFRNILPPVDICPRQLSHQFEPAMSLKDLYLLATCRENWQLETQPLQFREELPTATSSDASAFMSLQQRERSSDSWTDIQVLLHEQQEAREKESTEEYFRSLSDFFWATNEMLSRDPRRRFLLAITKTGADIRAWFFCRSHVVASHPIPSESASSPILKLLHCLSASSTAQLGYDPTIRSTLVNGHRQHIYSVGTSNFVTVRPLSAPSSSRIQGRGTRVWEVVAEGTSAPTYALKDTWIEADAKLEGDILRQILETLGDSDKCTIKLDHVANTSELPPDDPRYNLLSIQQDALVEIEPGVPDHTWDVMTGAAPATDIHSNSQGNRICPRKHYRVVFREVCTSMFEVENPFNAYRLLPGAIAALQNIHSCGWTHRDISPGNILSHHGVPKISDFEFSEEFEVDRRTPPQRKGETIGTAEFIAIEVQERRYLFSLRHPHTFQFNPLHDLESVWWIAIWALFQWRLDDSGECGFYQRANDLFRWCQLDTRDDLLRRGEPLFSEVLPPAALKPCIIVLDQVRNYLLDVYIAYEEGLPTTLNPDVFSEGQPHVEFRRLVAEAAACLRDLPFTPISTSRREAITMNESVEVPAPFAPLQACSSSTRPALCDFPKKISRMAKVSGSPPTSNKRNPDYPIETRSSKKAKTAPEPSLPPRTRSSRRNKKPAHPLRTGLRSQSKSTPG